MKRAIYTALVAALGTGLIASPDEKHFSYHAAGVLPYAVDAHGKVSFLLGLSSVHRDQASDFGGLRDDIDDYYPKKTAAREGCEELMFIFDDNSSFEKILTLRKKYGKNFDISKAQSASYKQLAAAISKNCLYSASNNYLMHFIEIPYQKDLPELFQQRKSSHAGLLPHCWNETLKLVWIRCDELFQAIDNRKPYGPVVIRNISLYEPFVQSLITARAHGIIRHIGA